MKSALERAAGFNPPRDIDRYLEDDAAYLRRRGLRGKSIELYAFLCRLCGPGEDRLIYVYQYELAEDLQRLAGKPAGYKPADLTKKLQTLQLRGFVRIIAGDGYCVEIVPADAVPVATSRSRLAVVSPADGRQGLLFEDEQPVLGIFSPDSDNNKKRNSVSVSISVSCEKRNSVSVSPSDRSIYPRAPAVEDEVEDEDESTGTNSEQADKSLEQAAAPVTRQEAAEASRALREIEARWAAVGLSPTRDRRQCAEDRSIIRRAHVLLQRGLIPESIVAEAIATPIDRRRQGRHVAKPAAQLTKRLFAYPGFARLLGAVREPLPDRAAEPPPARTSQPLTSEQLVAAAAAAGIRLPARDVTGERQPQPRVPPPEASPNGDHVQRE